MTDLDVRRVAVEAICDPRTVRKYLVTPADVRLSVRERIETAMKKLRVRNV